jgi:hypothetical protein
MGALKMNPQPAPPSGSWRFRRGERVGLAVGLFVILVFGANLEKRTALRRVPMTDLGVFASAAGAVRDGENLYTMCDWHGWHYQYPPTLAILFRPLALPVPAGPPSLPAGEQRTKSNTPWGYRIDTPGNFYGLDEQNARFFWIVAVWYVTSVVLIFLSAHALACVLEGSRLGRPPPGDGAGRRRWWALRAVPLLLCIGSLGTELSRGQVDVLTLAAISLGLYLAATGREFNAGICLSFPATVKLFPPFLLLYPFWRRRWRMTAGVVAGLVLALAVLPAVALGPRRAVELYRLWAQVLAKPALGQGTDAARAIELAMNTTDNQSLLAFIHNWKYHDLRRDLRPPVAAPWERYAVYAMGALMLLGVGVVSGMRRRDQPHELLIIAGTMIGLAFVVSPISHNFYYLVLLPLIAALLDRGLADPPGRPRNSGILLVLMIFMLVDILARLPKIGAFLRDAGVPLLSLVALMGAGAMVLLQHKDSAPANCQEGNQS